jgi:hypothetical protein
MLHIDKNLTYIVYPSFARFSYDWENLREYLSDPIKHDEFTRINYTKEDLISYGWSMDIQPFDLIGGPEGGGIIVVHSDIPRDKGWLPLIVLQKEANFRSPDCFDYIKTSDYHVRYLEPRDEPGAELGLGKKVKYYPLNVSAEHIESMPDNIFWLVGTKPQKKEMPELSKISEWAAHFKLQATRLQSPPEIVHSEISHWTKMFGDRDYFWFDIKGGGNGFGYHFAVMMYICHHLAHVAGRRMGAMYLLSSIEGKPDPYSGWVKRQQRRKE